MFWIKSVKLLRNVHEVLVSMGFLLDELLRAVWKVHRLGMGLVFTNPPGPSSNTVLEHC